MSRIYDGTGAMSKPPDAGGPCVKASYRAVAEEEDGAARRYMRRGAFEYWRSWRRERFLRGSPLK